MPLVAAVLAAAACGDGARREAPEPSRRDPEPVVRPRGRAPARSEPTIETPAPPVDRAAADVRDLDAPQLLATQLFDDAAHRTAAGERLALAASLSRTEAELFARYLEQLDDASLDLMIRSGSVAIEPVVRAAGEREAARDNAGRVLRGLARAGHDGEIALALRALSRERSSREFAMDVLVASGPEGRRELETWIAKDGADGERVLRWTRTYGAAALPLVRAHVAELSVRPPEWPTILAVAALGDAGTEFAPWLATIPPGPIRVPAGQAHRLVEKIRPGRSIDPAFVASWCHLDSCTCVPPLVGALLGDVRVAPEASRPRLFGVLADRRSSGMWDDVVALLARSGEADAAVEVLLRHLDARGPSPDTVLALARAGDAGADVVRARLPTWTASEDADVRALAVRAWAALQRPRPATDVELARIACGDDVARATGALEALWPRGDEAGAAAPILADGIRARLAACAAEGTTSNTAEVVRVRELLHALRRIGEPAGGAADAVLPLLDHAHLGYVALSTLAELGEAAVAGTERDRIAQEWLRRGRDPRPALELLMVGDGRLAPDVEERVWQVVLEDDRDGLGVATLVARGALDEAATERLFAWWRTGRKGPSDATWRSLLARAAPELARALDVQDRLTDLDEAERARLASDPLLAASLVRGLAPLLLRRDDRHAALFDLAIVGEDVVAPFLAFTASRSQDERADLETAFLLALRAVAQSRGGATARRLARRFLELRYGPFETRTGLPRDIPKERTDALRWAIYEATRVE